MASNYVGAYRPSGGYWPSKAFLSFFTRLKPWALLNLIFLGLTRRTTLADKPLRPQPPQPRLPQQVFPTCLQELFERIR